MRQTLITISLVTLTLGSLLLVASYKEVYPESTLLKRVISPIDGRTYQVRNDAPNPLAAANTLAMVRRELHHLCYFLPDTKGELLYRKLQTTEIMENPLSRPALKMTSYTVNKGEKMVLCLRDPTTLEIHDFDIIMYVVVHEAAHIVCPEIGHTPLFKQIFAEFLRAATQAGVLKRTDYRSQPMAYCGITISERVV